MINIFSILPKSVCVCFLILVLLFGNTAGNSSHLAAQSVGGENSDSEENLPEYEYKPYSNDEFPDWAIKLRRAESLFFGSIPVTYGVSAIIGNTLLSEYGNSETERQLYMIGSAAVLSISIALIDYLLGELGND